MRALPFMLLWFGWLTYWYIAADNAKGDARVESPLSRLSHELPLYAAMVLMLLTANRQALQALRFLPQGLGTYEIGLLLTALGLGLTVWARVHLGANWSVSVAHKHEHQLVRTGPYARVRHPIYSGLVLAFVGALVARGDLGALLACALGTLSLVLKLRREERWMREIFGEAYSAYGAEVPALFPRWR